MTQRFARFLVFSVFFVGFHFSSAQDRCGTVEYKSIQSPESEKQFEQWLQQRLPMRSSRARRQQTGPYQAPVVIHVIHNGEPVGTGANISDAQILSQLRVLNEDFNRLNADTANTPSEFASVAGSLNIEFVLAKQDREGLSTTGIVRVNGNKSGWVMADNIELKDKSYWPSEEYLNIWVCNLTDFLGYAQFPVSNLPGLEDSPDNADTDGIVIAHEAFGSIDDGPFALDPDYNKGRTLTHEMGHFFGLRHIWGDDDGLCDGQDYVDDTPNQGGSTGSCPAHPVGDNCATAIMFQNFMDYTDDACMNLFTDDQITRMSTVIENSPRRASLLVSPGLEDPVPVPNDLGIRQVLSPTASSCFDTVIPQIEVRNYGSNAITTARIELTVNNQVLETKDVNLNLPARLQSAIVNFNPVALSPEFNTFDFNILLTNGVADTATRNNAWSVSVFLPASIPIPFTETFNTLPSTWHIQNPDQQITWTLATAPKETPTNKSLFLDFFDYSNEAATDIFLSPVFDLSSVRAATLLFDVAYAQYPTREDRLKVIVVTDCKHWTEGTVVYDKRGASLATARSTDEEFVPSGANQWRNEMIRLTQFMDESHVQLAFIGINDFGNNLYIDNIAIDTSIVDDVRLVALTNPGPVTCDLSSTPAIMIENIGLNTSINNFTVEYTVNDGAVQTHYVAGTALEVSSQTTVELPRVLFREGLNVLSINLVNPNGVSDPTSENNTREFFIYVSTASDRIPLRENFDTRFETRWIPINPTGGTSWSGITTNFKTSAYFDAYNDTTIGDEAWLVSPVLDFSKASRASMAFDISYAIRTGHIDKLRVMGSRDCGNRYEFITDINLLGFSTSESPWTPDDESDWRIDNIVNLNALAGEDQVRIAFVATSDNGNNMFLDNAEFFVSDTPPMIPLIDPYSIYGYDLENPSQNDLRITFNLAERQDVPYTVVDLMGRIHAQGVLTDALNQTYPLPFHETLTAGIYIMKLKISDRYYATKILVSQ